MKRWLAHDVLPALRRDGRYDQAGDVGSALPEITATTMTRAQVKRLVTIIAKIEALQYGTSGRDWESLQHAKIGLLKLASRATAELDDRLIAA